MRRREAADGTGFDAGPPPHVGAHEKRGQDKVPQRRRPERVSLWASQDNRSKVRATCVRAVFFGLASAGSRLVRIHSTVRFGERSQAHMGDSGLLLSALWKLFLSLQSFFVFLHWACPVQGHWGVVGQGDQPATGTLAAAMSKPKVWVSPGLPDPLPPPALLAQRRTAPR